ncbi:DNA polymerase-3 subunit epsilon [Flavobacterium fontis]|jgi:DNA polymerase-3 subunit epsilon|uniref:DNA polymerase-3 subunit epsilon n=1 Tax=Flavobacterium fontis TaxID=1124188 RepID=A0A1M4Z7P4_9FLAO|nr:MULTISPECIES: exonuclease domain-containing protein [Flavobacterium]MCZ8168763.1 exonuclease domain-containing protein [Flavobacterium sp.]SHF13772.1 DNA polymerase-3 subunit epsilon [Flavobacterium fontis]
MLDWLKNIQKEYPEFWKTYLEKMDKKSNRYVAFTLETTGLNSRKDVILSIAAIGIVQDQVLIGDVFEIAIPQYKYLHDNGITHDFVLESKMPKLAEPAAIENFIAFIENAVLVGHRTYFDVEMLNEVLEKLGCGRLRNEALDIEIMYKKVHDLSEKSIALDEMAKAYKLPVTEHVSPTDDAYNIALMFLKLKSKLGLK